VNGPSKIHPKISDIFFIYALFSFNRESGAMKKSRFVSVCLVAILGLMALPAPAIGSDEDSNDTLVIAITNSGRLNGGCQVALIGKNLTPNTYYYVHAAISVNTPAVIHADKRGAGTAIASYGKTYWVKTYLPDHTRLTLKKGNNLSQTTWAPGTIIYSNTCK
jgi:hypothetical protein